MINRIANALVSTKMMAVLFILFSLAMGIGTFVESNYSTETAKIYIYEAKWFEIIMLLMVVTFIGNIKRYNLWQLNKWPLLMLHLSWILIILGAGVTRYIGYEGSMPIREGETSSVFLSERTYLTVLVDGNVEGQLQRKILEDQILITEQGSRNSLPWKSSFEDAKFKIELLEFIEGAKQDLIEDEQGDYYIKVVESGDGNRHDHYIKRGEIVNIHNVLFSYNKLTQGAINITEDERGNLFIESPFEGNFMRMADQFQGSLEANTSSELQLRSLYSIGEMQFVFPEFPVKGTYGMVKVPESEKTEDTLDAMILNLSSQNKSKEIVVYGGKGSTSFSEPIEFSGLTYYFRYGSKQLNLPFSIKLNDFIAEKYPGTERNYSSFMSKVTIEDERPFDYDIYMNHVLDHKGFRFFQASFFPDEKGSILSVNHDFWGTWITYIGYFLLYIGFMGIMFFGKTRFKDLAKSLKRIQNQKTVSAVLLFFALSSVYGQNVNSQLPSNQEIDSMIRVTAIDAEHAQNFAELVIQDDGGRMKPIHTFASELLRKLSYKDTYQDLSAEQVMLSMMLYPGLWYNTPFIALDKKAENDSIRKIIGIEEGQKYVKVTDFFDQRGVNKLDPFLEEAYKTNTPNKFQQDFKQAGQKLALLNRALSGEILKIFPLPQDENNKWISSIEYRTGVFTVSDTLYGSFVANSLPYYLQLLNQAQISKDYTEADKILNSLKKSQRKLGQEVMPSERKIKAEISYNKWDVFNKLYRYYALFGLVLFFVLVAQIYKDRRTLKVTIKAFKVIIYALVVMHTFGLIARSYISGHAPWSDAYESILYVSWATMAIGIALGRKSNFTIASTTFVSSMLLWIAHQSWVDPAIANLQPVLDSYWLMIHVAVIVGSYGPLTVGMILGVVNLILLLLLKPETRDRMKSSIKELTIINELSLTIGLLMLTIGNFLGGQWANESWGRYWGWDPKETWALISIMVYAFVLHMRLIPNLKGVWAFNIASIIAFASIMMTYFGVNFYLVGLHSYASGDQVITPSFVWYTVAGVLVLGYFSYLKYKKYY